MDLWTDFRRTNGQTDGDSPLCTSGHHPLRVRCLKGEGSGRGRREGREGNGEERGDARWWRSRNCEKEEGEKKDEAEVKGPLTTLAMRDSSGRFDAYKRMAKPIIATC